MDGTPSGAAQYGRRCSLLQSVAGAKGTHDEDRSSSQGDVVTPWLFAKWRCATLGQPAGQYGIAQNVIAMGAGPLPFLLAVDEIAFDFYSTAAQVIPLIFVALAFEFRGQGGQFLPADLLPSPPERQRQQSVDETRTAETSPKGRAILRWAAVYTFLMTLVLATGEVVALHVLAYDDIWEGSRLVVGATLTIGALGIVVPIGIQQLNTWTRLRRLHARATGEHAKEPAEAAVENVPLTALKLLAAILSLLGAVIGGLDALTR